MKLFPLRPIIRRALFSGSLIAFVSTLSVPSEVSAELFFWFDAVSGDFNVGKHWYASEDGTLSPFNLNPNPNNRLPATGDSVKFTRTVLFDVTMIGVPYEVTVPSATVAMFTAGPDAFPLTLEPLTFNVVRGSTLKAETLDLRGKIVLKGRGEVVGNGVENVLTDVTVTDKTTVRLNVLRESGSLILEDGSSLTANRLDNFVRGLVLKGASSLKADSVLANGGVDSEGFYYPVISESSTLETPHFELLQGWMLVSSGAKLHTGTTKLGDREGLAAVVFVTGEGSEWVATNTVEEAGARVRDRGAVRLADTTGLSADVAGAGSRLEFGFAFGSDRVRVDSGGAVTGRSLILFGGSGGCYQKDSSIKLTEAFDLGIGGSTLFFEIGEGGLVECKEATLASGEGGEVAMRVMGTGSFWRVHGNLFLGKVAPAKASLIITEGGNVTVGPELFPSTQTVSIGQGSAVQVSGVNSVFNTRFTASTVLGTDASLMGPATARIASGGSFLARKLVLGSEIRGEGIVTVEGTGSRLDVGHSILVGGTPGAKGTLSITNGATAKAPAIELGKSAEANLVVITGSDSSLTLGESLVVGSDGVGAVTVAARGKLVMEGRPSGGIDVTLALTRDSRGTLVVDGGSAATTTAGISSTADFQGRQMAVGLAGTGVITISGGGSVNVDSCYLGYARSSSAAALVTGQTGDGYRSNWRVAKNMVVGGRSEPTPASLDVNSSGFVHIGETLRITEKGTVRVNDGSILVGIGEAGRGDCIAGRGGTILLHPAATMITSPGRLDALPGGQITGRLPLAPMAPLNLSSAALDHRRGSALVSKATKLDASASGPATLQGALSIQGGTLLIEVGDGTANSPVPALRVTGPVSLGGKLVLQFTDSFAPRTGEKFNLFQFDSTVTGQFAEIDVVGLAQGFQYDLTPDASGLYTLTALTDGAATSPLVLSIQLSGAELMITWPETATGYLLQSTSGFGMVDWQLRPTTSNRLTVPMAQPREFFRLIRP